MTAWSDIFIQQATAAPDWTSSASIAFNNQATTGNKVVLFITTSSDRTANVADLTNNGWELDYLLAYGQSTYVFSQVVPVGGLPDIEVTFSGSNKPILRMLELTGVSAKSVANKMTGTATTGSITTPEADMLVFGGVQAVNNGGQPTYDVWSNSFTNIGSLRSFASPPYTFPSAVVSGLSYYLPTDAGVFSSAATMGGDNGPAVLDPAGFIIAYSLGAIVPKIDLGGSISIGLGYGVNRTAVEDNGGDEITERSWVIQSGPVGVGTTVGTTATLTWTPSVAGVYTIQYSATNSAGTGRADLQVIIVEPIQSTASTSPFAISLPSGTYRSRIRAEGPGGVSGWSTWSAPFEVDSGDLALPRIAWEGGSNYWSRFTRATASGWTDTSYFPISVFYGRPDPTHVASLKDAGVNLFMGVEHNGPLSNVTDEGVYAMPGLDWSLEEVGEDNRAVAWFISDEFDMGMGVDNPEAGEYGWLAEQQALVDQARGYNDGRFCHANFGNGILRTYWSQGTMADHIALMDSASADKYTYTSPAVADIIDGGHDAPDWPNGTPVNRAYSYGWQADQMRRFQDPSNLKPIWTFVETARPYLTEDGALTIEPGQIEGAVWSALIHEARGIAYFQHNNDETYGGNYSIVDIPTVHAKVKQINAKVMSLAPVLNTQSYYNTTVTVNNFTYYRYSFGNATDTMLKTYDWHLYIFAGLGMGHATGSKTFTLPAGVLGTTVEVVGEGRTIAIDDGEFSDTFDYEYTHHVYKISLLN